MAQQRTAITTTKATEKNKKKKIKGNKKEYGKHDTRRSDNGKLSATKVTFRTQNYENAKEWRII